MTDLQAQQRAERLVEEWLGPGNGVQPLGLEVLAQAITAELLAVQRETLKHVDDILSDQAIMTDNWEYAAALRLARGLITTKAQAIRGEMK